MDIINWVFQKKSVIRATNIQHHLNDPKLIQRGQASNDYKEGDDVYFSVNFEQMTSQGEWIPYESEDIQLEFVRLDPYWRVKLNHAKGSKTYSANFRTPDQNGVYKFKIDYSRYGLS